MAKTVDHDARCTQIIDALLELAAREGLHAATMRAVAAEAGVSVRLLQYYFETKERLVERALAALADRSMKRWDERVARSPDPSAPTSVLRGFIDEALPTDEHSSRFQLLFLSDLTLRPASTGASAAGPRALRGRLERALGESSSDLVQDPRREAAALMALVHGLGTGILAGLHDAAEASAIAHAHLDRVLQPRG